VIDTVDTIKQNGALRDGSFKRKSDAWNMVDKPYHSMRMLNRK